MSIMKYKYNALLRHPGYNGDFADDVLGFDPNGGGIYDIPIIGDVADAVVNSFVGNVIAFAFPPAAPFIYAAKSAQALASGNELGALLNAVGAYTAYASPTATTTANLGGMEISGLNANLVNATNQAIAGGASVTDVAKTLVGMGDQQAAAKILQSAGQDSATAMDALNAAGQEAANYVPTAADAAQSVVAMKAAGFSAADISVQVENWASVIPKDQISTAMGQIGAPASWAGLSAPISNIGDIPTSGYTDAELATMNHYGAENFGTPAEDIGMGGVSSPSYTAGTLTDGVPSELTGSDPSTWNPAPEGGAGGIGGGDPIYAEPYINGGELTNAQVHDLEYGDLANQSQQSRMLMDQYRGFTQDEILQHMAGSAIDPVMGEEILAGLGMDEFAVSDYMTKNPNSFGNTYADPSFLDRLKSANKSLQSLKNIIGSKGGGTGSGGGRGVESKYTDQYMRMMDPYFDYRKSTEIPMMGAAAGTAGKLSGLYQQSYDDPVGMYNRPEMQALNQQFMQETARKDAALGRNSQYGARGVEAQNNFLTKSLPQYRTGLNQGLQTMYTAARPQPFKPEAAQWAAKEGANQARAAGSQQYGGLIGTASNLSGSYNQMVNGDNFFDQAQGAVNTVSGLQNLYEGGTKAYDTVSGWFA